MRLVLQFESLYPQSNLNDHTYLLYVLYINKLCFLYKFDVFPSSFFLFIYLFLKP